MLLNRLLVFGVEAEWLPSDSLPCLPSHPRAFFLTIIALNFNFIARYYAYRSLVALAAVCQSQRDVPAFLSLGPQPRVTG